MSKLEQNTRRELTAAVAARYRTSTKREKALILDEFTAITGFHRKHAIRLLNAGPSGKQPTKQRRGTVYDEAVRQALIVLWEASDRICGKRPWAADARPARRSQGTEQNRVKMCGSTQG